MAIGERADDAGASPNLLHDPLEWIIGAYLLPVDVGKDVVGQRLVNATLDQIGRGVHPGCPQVFDDRLGFAIGHFPALLSVGNPPVISSFTPSGNTTVNQYTPVTYTVNLSANSTTPVTYQWSRDGTVLTSQTNSTLAIPGAQASDAGKYDVQVSNAWGNASANANV